jgi:hypothetical protein
VLLALAVLVLAGLVLFVVDRVVGGLAAALVPSLGSAPGAALPALGAMIPAGWT